MTPYLLLLFLVQNMFFVRKNIYIYILILSKLMSSTKYLISIRTNGDKRNFDLTLNSYWWCLGCQSE